MDNKKSNKGLNETAKTNESDQFFGTTSSPSTFVENRTSENEKTKETIQSSTGNAEKTSKISKNLILKKSIIEKSKLFQKNKTNSKSRIKLSKDDLFKIKITKKTSKSTKKQNDSTSKTTTGDSNGSGNTTGTTKEPIVVGEIIKKEKSLFTQRLYTLISKEIDIKLYNFFTTIIEILFPIVIVLLFSKYRVEVIRRKGNTSLINETENNFMPQNLTINPQYFHESVQWILKEPINFSNVQNITSICYAPQNKFTYTIFSRYKNLSNIELIKFNNHFEIEEFVKKSESKLGFGVYFENDTDLASSNDIGYILEYNSAFFAYRSRLSMKTWADAPMNITKNNIKNELMLITMNQYYINNRYIRILCHKNKIKCQDFIRPIKIYRMPYPEYKTKSLMKESLSSLGIVILLGYIFFATTLLGKIVGDKNSKMKELILMSGVSEVTYFISIFITNFIIFFISSFVITYIIDRYDIVYSTNIIFIFFVFLLFSLQIMFFTTFISIFFNRPKIAVIFIFIFWIFLTIFSNQKIQKLHSDPDDLNWLRTISCFLPTSSIVHFLSQVYDFESESLTLSFTTMTKETINYGNFTVAHTLLYMISSYFIYFLLIFYLGNVWPFQEKRKPICFIFDSSYWGQNSTKNMNLTQNTSQIERNPKNFENHHKNTKPLICLSKVCKKFTQKSVIENLNLEIFPNEITVLLGQNGAGKTTTMNMITGLLNPTSGTVYVNDYNASTQTVYARKDMFLCPQDSVFIPEYTVYQHLKFFLLLKGPFKESLGIDIAKMLELLEMKNCINLTPNKLSGGTKRKLSLAISLIGNSSTVILDEPTSGLDPDNRKAVWDTLKSMKKDKTILMTTHNMDEADFLGDRVVILSQGTIKCDGTPTFLKQSLGAGYKLKITKLENFNAEETLKEIQKYIAFSYIFNNTSTECLYYMEATNKNNDMPKLMNLFENIENNKKDLKIDTIGLSLSTLEDVFIKITSEDTNDSNLPKRSLIKDKFELTRYEDKLNGFELMRTQIFALLKKRFIYLRRSTTLIFLQWIVPILIMITGASLKNQTIDLTDPLFTQFIKLDTELLYGKNTKSFYYGKDTLFKEYESIITQRENGIVLFHTNTTNLSEISENILKNVNKNLSEYRNKYLYGIGVIGNEYHLWLNFEQTYSILLGINILYDTIFCHIFGGKNCTAMDIKINPINKSPLGDTIISETIDLNWKFICLGTLPLMFGFFVASFVIFAAEEINSKTKLIQFMTRLSPVGYWSANYIFDMMIHVLMTFIFFIILFIFDYNSLFYYSNSLSSNFALFLMTIFYGFSIIPLMYLFSIFFNGSKNYLTFTLLFTVAIIFMINFGISFDNFEVIIKRYEREHSYLLLFCALPFIAYMYAFQKLFLSITLEGICGKVRKMEDFEEVYCKEQINALENRCCPKPSCNDCSSDYSPYRFNNNGVGLEMFYLIISGFVLFIVLILYEYNRTLLRRFWDIFHRQYDVPLNLADDDVKQEQKRVQDQIERQQIKDILLVVQLHKSFRKWTAVYDLTFGVHHGECFGLLGVNGAGKTTTFSILVGDVTPNGGEAYLMNGRLCLSKNVRMFRTKIGYCPQYDAIHSQLTGKETLQYYASINGIPEVNHYRDVQNIAKMCDLTEYLDKRVKTYSGGTKRKLSIAVALIGNPKVLFLDEPTTGIDPASRRKIWQTLDYVRKEYGTSILLTSHSMDECEAVCSRIGIMIHGGLRCLGTSQHLRAKYGQGFNVVITLKNKYMKDKQFGLRIENDMKSIFPSSSLKDFYMGLMSFHISDSKERLSNVIKQMIKLSEKYDFEDYLVSDTTLEQVFLKFARTREKAKKISKLGL